MTTTSMIAYQYFFAQKYARDVQLRHEQNRYWGPIPWPIQDGLLEETIKVVDGVMAIWSTILCGLCLCCIYCNMHPPLQDGKEGNVDAL